MSTLNFLIDYNPVSFVFNKFANTFRLFSHLSNYFGSLIFNKANASVEKLFTGIGVCAMTYFALQKLYKTALFWKWVPAHNANRKKLSA